MTTRTRQAPGFFSAAIFYLINIILFPVSFLGYIIWIGVLLLNSGKSRVSGTAQGPLSARWTQHTLGTRPDEAASRLLLALPGVPKPGMWLISTPMLLAHRLTGYVPKTFQYPFEGDVEIQVEAAARQTFFDGLVDKHTPEITQLVILGAGFDTRAWRLPEGTPVRTFEVDMPQTQALKCELLANVGVDTTRATFVPADFEKDDWLARLVAEGFDTKKKALFLWEGVTMYLDEEAVRDTLSKIGTIAKGSVVAFDFFSDQILLSNSFYMRFARATTKAAGEPLKFGVNSTPSMRDRLAELLQSCGLTLVEGRIFGDETGDHRAWGGFAVAAVK